MLAGFFLFLLPAVWLPAGQLPEKHWELLTIVYPPDRNITVALGGAEKSLNAKGTCKVKWRKDAATLEIEIKDLPSMSDAGWTGRQYVLWAVDREKRTLNLGLVPVKGKDAKWELQAPFRAFGLLVTAEQDPKATAPSTAVALESLLPKDPNLVLPIYRVELALGSPPA
jgi:hypothetical protein